MTTSTLTDTDFNKPAINNFYCWEFINEIDEITCKRIINLGKNKWEKGAIYKRDTIKEHIRKSEVVWVDNQWIYDLAFKYMKIANQNSGWNFDIDYAQTMQITKYDKNGHYDYHFDGDGYSVYNTPDNKFTHGKTRKLSMSIILNKDYEGGEFQFFNQDKLKTNKQGTIIVFPSYLVHKVNPVTKGTRYSLVVWFVGRPFK